MDNYYIYIYLDPRKPGQYCYDDICFSFKPMYIGKGKNKRWLENKRNLFLKNKINKIKQYSISESIISRIKTEKFGNL